MAQSLHGRWMIDHRWQGRICVYDDEILRLDKLDCDPVEFDSLPRFMPAPVDLHVHGGGGADVMGGDDALRTVLRAHARSGTGAMLATSVTAPTEQIDEFIASVRRVMDDPPEDGAVLLGAHLEGPFINPDKRGAQPDFACSVDPGVLEGWLRTGAVRVISYAPEMDSEQRVLPLCQRYGVKAQIGHSLCHWSVAQSALQAGAGITHLYNAMSGVRHRDGGVALAALSYAKYAEIITDGIHVDKAAFDLARRSIERLYCVTDATAAAGMPDGTYQLGSLRVEKTGNRVQMPDGTLAGSCLTQSEAMAKLKQWKLGWPEIVCRVSEYPSRWIGAETLGRIGPGAFANWLEIDKSDKPVALWICGRRMLLQTDTVTQNSGQRR